MKITKKRLMEIIRQELKEVSGTTGGTHGTKLRGKSKIRKSTATKTKQASRRTYDLAKAATTQAMKDLDSTQKDYTTKSSAYDAASAAYQTHMDSEQDRYADVPDQSRWTHPHSNVTTTLGPGDIQPKKGWQYRQATTTSDKTKWTHPYEPGEKPGTLKTYDVGKTGQPALGWQFLPGKGVKGKPSYGAGSVKDFKLAQAPKGYMKSVHKATTNPTTTSYASQYGQGGQAQYDLDRRGAGRDQFTKALATTNPTTQQQTSGWTTWETDRGTYADQKATAKAAADAADDAVDTQRTTTATKRGEETTAKSGWEQATSDLSKAERELKATKAKTGFGFSAGGGGRVGGKGGVAKSSGIGKKGKGGKKSKKKNESLFDILGRDFINEMNSLKKYIK